MSATSFFLILIYSTFLTITTLHSYPGIMSLKTVDRATRARLRAVLTTASWEDDDVVVASKGEEERLVYSINCLMLPMFWSGSSVTLLATVAIVIFASWSLREREKERERE